MSLKITSTNDKTPMTARKVPMVKEGARFLLPRYQAQVMQCRPHEHNADLYVVKFRIMEGPNRGKTYDTLVPAVATLDCTDNAISRFMYWVMKNPDRIAAGVFLMSVVFAFAAYHGVV